LNAELQKIARGDKKAFLGDQYKEIEEDNRMGKTTDLLKKIRDNKETFHEKMGISFLFSFAFRLSYLSCLKWFCLLRVN